jgi:hypothetical protein
MENNSRASWAILKAWDYVGPHIDSVKAVISQQVRALAALRRDRTSITNRSGLGKVGRPARRTGIVPSVRVNDVYRGSSVTPGQSAASRLRLDQARRTQTGKLDRLDKTLQGLASLLAFPASSDVTADLIVGRRDP